MNRLKKVVIAAMTIGLTAPPAMAVRLQEQQSQVMSLQKVEPKELQLSTTVNQLSGQLLSSKLKHTGLENAMVSSVSLYYAMSILESGAAGDSAELLRSLLVSSPSLEVSNVASALEGVLVSSDSGYPGEGFFKLINSVWSTNGDTNDQPFVFSEQFQADSQHYYHASVHSIDFMATGAAQILNEWACDSTEGLISEVMDDLTLKGLEWVIMNAAYFEGSWATEMRRVNKNEDYQFTLIDGTRIQADTIVTRDFKSSVLDREDGSIAFGLPFIGGKYSLVVYTPPVGETDLKQWLIENASVDMPEVVTRVLENRSKIYNLFIKLPIFTFSDKVEMLKDSDIAIDLGLSQLFSDKANFNPMIDREKSLPRDKETRVGIIKQNTKIELDEKGVRAAAVTLIGGMIKSTSIAPPMSRREIIVDRPFAFAIVENRSQTMLFNGIFIRPE